MAHSLAGWRRQGRVLLPCSGQRETLGLSPGLPNRPLDSARIRVWSAGGIRNSEWVRSAAGRSADGSGGRCHDLLRIAYTVHVACGAAFQLRGDSIVVLAMGFGRSPRLCGFKSALTIHE